MQIPGFGCGGTRELRCTVPQTRFRRREGGPVGPGRTVLMGNERRCLEEECMGRAHFGVAAAAEAAC